MKFFTNDPTDSESADVADLPGLASDLAAWVALLDKNRGIIRLKDDCPASFHGTLNIREYDPKAFTCLTLREQTAGELHAVLNGDMIKFRWRTASNQGSSGRGEREMGISGYDKAEWKILGNAEEVQECLDLLCAAAQQAMMQQLEPARHGKKRGAPRHARRRGRRGRAGKMADEREIKWPTEDEIVVGTRNFEACEELHAEVRRYGAALYEMAMQVLGSHPIGHHFDVDCGVFGSVDVYRDQNSVLVNLWIVGGKNYCSFRFDGAAGLMQFFDSAAVYGTLEPVAFGEYAEASAPGRKDLAAYRTAVPLMAQVLEDAIAAQLPACKAAEAAAPDGVPVVTAPMEEDSVHPDVAALWARVCAMEPGPMPVGQNAYGWTQIDHRILPDEEIIELQNGWGTQWWICFDRSSGIVRCEKSRDGGYYLLYGGAAFSEDHRAASLSGPPQAELIHIVRAVLALLPAAEGEVQ